MSLPALIGFAGVLVAAVATGLLAGRAVRRPRLDTIVWTAATLALTVALAAQSMGFASGFGPATFRAVQLSALLLAPLWLAWGLAERVWPGEAARFGTRLACGALTVVGSVILVTDPLTAAPFGKGWPLAGLHYQPPSHYALDVVQAVAVILAAASIGLAAARARTEGPWPGALPGTALVGLAVFLTVGLRFSLPSRSAYPLFSLLAAALAWFGATRLEAQLAARPGPGPAAAARPARNRRDVTAPPAVTGRPAATRGEVIGWPAATRRDMTGQAGSGPAGTRGSTRRTATTAARPRTQRTATTAAKPRTQRTATTGARPRTRRTATAGRGPPVISARPVTSAPRVSRAGGPIPAGGRRAPVRPPQPPLPPRRPRRPARPRLNSPRRPGRSSRRPRRTGGS